MFAEVECSNKMQNAKIPFVGSLYICNLPVFSCREGHHSYIVPLKMCLLIVSSPFMHGWIFKSHFCSIGEGESRLNLPRLCSGKRNRRETVLGREESSWLTLYYFKLLIVFLLTVSSLKSEWLRSVSSLFMVQK